MPKKSPYRKSCRYQIATYVLAWTDFGKISEKIVSEPTRLLTNITCGFQSNKNKRKIIFFSKIQIDSGEDETLREFEAMWLHYFYKILIYPWWKYLPKVIPLGLLQIRIQLLAFYSVVLHFECRDHKNLQVPRQT